MRLDAAVNLLSYVVPNIGRTFARERSTANQVHENGLNGRVPYDVGRSINTWQSTPIVATAHSIAKLAGGSVE